SPTLRRCVATLCQVDQSNLFNFTGSDGLVQLDWYCIDAIVCPIRILVYVVGKLRGAVGEMNLDIQIVAAAAQIIIPGADSQFQLADLAAWTQDCRPLRAE